VGGPGRRRVGGVEEDGGGVDGAPRPAGPVPDRKRRSLTRPDKAAAPIPDLVGRDFTAEQIDQRWCGDLTEIPTGEGKLYLAIVLDLASRRLPGFALGEHHDSELANAALYMAAAVRGGDVDGVVFTPTRAASTSGTCSRRRAPHSG
jgi:putative transposase